MDCSLSCSSVLGISQARILKWAAISFSRGPSQPRDGNCVFYIGRQILYHWVISLVQFNSVTQLCLTLWDPWIAAHQASLSITNSWSLPKLMSIELVMPSRYLILCPSLLLLPPIPPSIRVFLNESTLCMRQRIGVSALSSVLPMNTQDWSPLGWTLGWIDDSLALSFLYSPTCTSIHDHGKNHSLD